MFYKSILVHLPFNEVMNILESVLSTVSDMVQDLANKIYEKRKMNYISPR